MERRPGLSFGRIFDGLVGMLGWMVGIASALIALGLLALGLIMLCQTDAVGPALTMILVAAVALVLLVWVAVAAHRGRLHPHADGPASSDAAARCPDCDTDDVVRGLGQPSPFQGVFWARCLTCGERWRVKKSAWRALPEPNAGDPYETFAERTALAKRTHLTRRRVGGLLPMLALALIAAWWISGLLVTLLSGNREGWFLLAAIVLIHVAYGVWAVLFPPARRAGRRCVQCGYDLRGSTEPRCPECGTPSQTNVG